MDRFPISGRPLLWTSSRRLDEIIVMIMRAIISIWHTGAQLDWDGARGHSAFGIVSPR